MSTINTEDLDAHIAAMYRDVAAGAIHDLHFPTGRPLAEALGYPADLLDRVPAEAVDSFAGVGYHFHFAALREGERVLDLGSGSGMDAFAAATQVGHTGSVTGVDITPEQLAKAERLTWNGHVTFRRARIEELPFDDGTFDAVISNGVVNLSPRKRRVFAEAARVLRPGGRLALADIVSGTALKETTRRNVELWAACIAGAIPRANYVETIEAAGFEVGLVRGNDYRFISDRALDACSTYGVESVSLVAVKR